MHIKIGDKVVVTTGKDAGERGEVITIDRNNNRVKVSRRNMMVKHRKPNPITGDEGARIEVEAWIHASNVALYSEKADGPVRTQARFVGKGGDLFATKLKAKTSFGKDVPAAIQKVRFATKTGETFDTNEG